MDDLPCPEDDYTYNRLHTQLGAGGDESSLGSGSAEAADDTPIRGSKINETSTGDGDENIDGPVF